MKFVECPTIGKRALSEFVYGGLYQPEPDQNQATQQQWSEFLFYRNSAPQTQEELWYHRPTGIWFLFSRNTLSDVISEVRLATEGVSRV